MKEEGRNRSNCFFPFLLLSCLLCGISISLPMMEISPIASAVHVGKTFLFPVFMFALTPLVLVLNGAVAVAITKRSGIHKRPLLTSYCSGFLTGLIAFAIFSFGSGMNQYVPFLQPGMTARLVFASGMTVMYLTSPVILAIIAVCSLFSLAGGLLACKVAFRQSSGAPHA